MIIRYKGLRLVQIFPRRFHKKTTTSRQFHDKYAISRVRSRFHSLDGTLGITEDSDASIVKLVGSLRRHYDVIVT